MPSRGTLKNLAIPANPEPGHDAKNNTGCKPPQYYATLGFFTIKEGILDRHPLMDRLTRYGTTR
jgi:hypothetical protein